MRSKLYAEETRRSKPIIVAAAAIIITNILCTAWSVSAMSKINAEYKQHSCKCCCEIALNEEVDEEIEAVLSPAIAAEPEQEIEHEIVNKETTEPATVVTKHEIPSLSTKFKSYMSYKTITNQSSVQYSMQQNAWTDENGFRRYGDAYMVAMGTAYAEQCGEYFLVTFDTGESIWVVTGDIKADSHTDKTNSYSPVYDSNGALIYANVLEFIVDTDVLPLSAKRLGTVENLENLQGNITSIEKRENVAS